jgi:ABC-type oligopeptide transport system ATPase subunit
MTTFIGALQTGESDLVYHADDPRVVPLLPEEDHSGEAAVTIDAVSKVFSSRHGTVAALDNISLSVAPGEFVCLLGASGCGKSTLLNLISKLDYPTSGTVTSVGRPALMFQEAALFPWLTAGQNIALALKYADVPKNKRKARINELLDLVRLSGHADRRVHELSGGQRQRVGIARALALEPRLLVADEPTSALDVSVQARVLALFQELQREQGFACLFISHDLGVVEILASRIAVMYRGKIVEIGDREQIVHDPQHEYTRRLVSAVPVPDPAEQRRRRQERDAIIEDAGVS